MQVGHVIGWCKTAFHRRQWSFPDPIAPGRPPGERCRSAMSLGGVKPPSTIASGRFQPQLLLADPLVCDAGRPSCWVVKNRLSSPPVAVSSTNHLWPTPWGEMQVGHFVGWCKTTPHRHRWPFSVPIVPGRPPGVRCRSAMSSGDAKQSLTVTSGRFQPQSPLADPLGRDAGRPCCRVA